METTEEGKKGECAGSTVIDIKAENFPDHEGDEGIQVGRAKDPNQI